MALTSRLLSSSQCTPSHSRRTTTSGLGAGRPQLSVPAGAQTAQQQGGCRPWTTWRTRAANHYEKVSDCMTFPPIFSCTPDTTIDEALEMLVAHRITGLPVVATDNSVVGVVSDYDLLALDALGKVNADAALFPEADTTWQAFKEVKKLLAKTSGTKVKDVMTAQPITVRQETNLEEAAKILLTKKIHRLPVVDSEGKLIGILSRGNLVRAVLELHRASTAAEKLKAA